MEDDEDDKDGEGDQDQECKPAKNTSASASMMRLKQGKCVLEKHLTTTIKCLMNKDKNEKENTTEKEDICHGMFIRKMPDNAYLDVSPDTFKNIPVDVFQEVNH